MDSGIPSTSRRAAMIQFLRAGGAAAAVSGLGVWLNGRNGRQSEPAVPALRTHFQVAESASLPQMAVVQGSDPAQLARRAIEELGGIRRFISRGDVVVVKPNAAWDRVPEQAANTNPQVVAEVCRMCLEAGARGVIVTDVTIHAARLSFARSGIGAAARAVGAEIVLPEERLFREIDLRGEVLGVWPVLEPFLKADKVINVPIAKHHSLTGVSLGIKNWYGILGGRRQRLHQRIHESLADLADFMRPTLTLIDAFRVLVRNGPGGGSLSDVVLKKSLIAGTDPVALDAYAAKAFWNTDPYALRYLRAAAGHGLGTLDLAAVRSRFVAL
jgi:uncharacterized protein (DUF362 family)